MKAVQSLSVGLLRLGDVTHDSLRVIGQLGEASLQRAEARWLKRRTSFLLGGLNGVPGAAVSLLPFRLAFDQRAKLAFFLLPFGDEALVRQALILAGVGFDRILEREDQPLRLPGLLWPLRGITLQDFDAALESFQGLRVGEVAQRFYMRHRIQTISRTRMSGDEHQFAIRRAFRVPLQIVFALDWFAVLVDAEERQI